MSTVQAQQLDEKLIAKISKKNEGGKVNGVV